MVKAKNRAIKFIPLFLALAIAGMVAGIRFYPKLTERMGFGVAAVPLFNPTLTYPDMYNGPLYATSEQIGDGYPIEKYFKNLDRNGINYFIGFFALSGTQNRSMLNNYSGLGYIVNAVQKYPKRIIPFFNPGMGGDEVEPLVGKKLTALYSSALTSSKEIVGSGIIKGFGEIETQEWNFPHNDARIIELIKLAGAHKIHVMFHPVASKIGDVKKLVAAYPNTTFLIHMYRSDLDKSRDALIKIIKAHNNIYFSIDAAHIAHYDGNDMLYEHTKSSKFIADFDAKYDTMLKSAVSDYTPLVNAVPTKVMWGTEAGPEYSFDAAVYDRLIKISRDLIGRLPLEHQEGVGYKNALRVFGEGVALTTPIQILDASSLPHCSDTTIDACDSKCGIVTDDDAIDPVKDACFQMCLVQKRCIDPE